MLWQKKILVVDDETQLVAMVQMQLEAHGFTVITAYDGEEALRKVREEAPDAVILDLMLPAMSGYMICSFLKNDERFSNIPVIICSARTQTEDVKLGEKVGADAYIMKPFDPQKLVNKVKELLKMEP